MSIILIALDGLGDRPISRGKTPLQLAKTPNFDKMAKNGINGISYPLKPGLVLGSDTGYLALFGYDPTHFYVGRGILEALGSNTKLYEGDIALRCNFCTIDSNFEITDRRAGRIENKEAEKLANSLSKIKIKGFTFVFEHTVGHRGVLIIRGKHSSPMITDTDSHKEGLVQWPKPGDNTMEAKSTADALTEWMKEAHKILKDHQINKDRKKKKLPLANFVITRGASGLVEGSPFRGATYSGMFGKSVKIDKFVNRYGLSASCIAGGALYKGIGKYVGMDVIDVKKATGGMDTDQKAKVSAVISEVKKGTEFIFLHFKGTDIAGHDGNWKAKVKIIEKIDKAIAPLLKLKDTIIVSTADHSTPCALKAHSADPVPVIIWGPAGTVRVDGVKKFDEILAAQGGLGRLSSQEILPIALGIIGKAPMYGS